jgi:competence protein ComEC
MVCTLVADSITVRNNRHGIFYGYGTIVNGTKFNDWLANERVFFSVETSFCMDIPVRGQKFDVSGILKSVRADSKWWFQKHLGNLQVKWQISDGCLLRCRGSSPPLRLFFKKIFDKFSHTVTVGVGGKEIESGIMLGMLTGDKRSMAGSLRAMFSDLGIAHLFAVSGLHIGIIATAIDMFLRILCVRKKCRIFPVLFLLALYVNAIGCSQSSMRALTMVAFYFAATLLGRRPNVLSALTNSALLHTLYDPFAAFNISFLLSYAAVAGIVLIGLPLKVLLSSIFLNLHGLKIECYPRMFRIFFKFKGTLIVSFSISLAGYLVSLPLSIEYFGMVPLFTIPLNMLAVPLATAAIVVGAMSLFLGLCSLWPICAILNKISCFLIGLFRILSQSMYCEHCCFRNVEFPVISGTVMTALILVGSYVFFFCRGICDGAHSMDAPSLQSGGDSVPR